MFRALVDPNAFFGERAGDPSLRRPALVVATVAVIGTISAAYSLSVMRAQLPAEAQGLVTIILGVGVAGSLLGPFIGWLVFSLFYYLISGFFGGEGSYRDTLALAGYGYLPRVFGAVVALALTVVLYQTVPPTGNYQTYAAAIAASPYTKLSTVLGWVFLVWQGFLTTYAVKHARSVSFRDAAISVWVPVGLYLLVSVAGFALQFIGFGGTP
ncbi:Yip1 family protein [Halocalculus aciditolerans]|uniref:Yip1 domain-containing protein n=1 Tax=Halocalculus aciditolerans TaxID=1383812 RepID=A0A830FIW2_9EURY|nr:YIP1 family protein [Halocalculus aciditolerans]GGL60450.1 hypothetical protein GCM10009039_18370 [Halocalculus aciditolerans]